MEPSDLGPERAMRQYLAHLLESDAGGGCTRSVGCLDRFLVQGMNNFPPPQPPQPPSSTSLSLEAKASRCSLFEQLLNGGRRGQERLLVPDLATNWFRKQKVFLDKLSPEELAAISKGLAQEDEGEEPKCSCLEEKKSQQERRRLPAKQHSKHCRPICGCSEVALGALGTKDALEEPVPRPPSECLPTSEPKSRNPFLLNTDTEEKRSKRKLLWDTSHPPASASATPQRRSCSSLKAQRARASCSWGPFPADAHPCLAARRTESMLPRLRCKVDLRQAPQRRLDPAHFRRISPEFFRILASYEAAMSEICPLYGISMHHWGETAECCPCEEPPPDAWQEQHFLGDDAVATAVVSPGPARDRKREKQEKKEREKKEKEKQEREQEKKEREQEKKEKKKEQQQEKRGKAAKRRASQQKEKDKERDEDEEDEEKDEDNEENQNRRKRRSRSSSSKEPPQRQKKPGMRPCHNDTCPAMRNYDQEELQQWRSGTSSYSCAHCAAEEEEEERQTQRRRRQEESRDSFKSTTSDRSRRDQEQERQQRRSSYSNRGEEQRRNINREEVEQVGRNIREQEQKQQWRRPSLQPQEQQQEIRPPPRKWRRTLKDCFRGKPTTKYHQAAHPCNPPPTAPTLGGMYPGCRPLYCPKQPKGILNGFTGICKRHLLYNLSANNRPNREKYAQMQQDKQRSKRLRGRERPERERPPVLVMGQTSTPYIFASEPAPCTWQKHKYLDVAEMQPEDSNTTLKPYVSCREEERQQEEPPLRWFSDDSLIFRTPDSERTLAGGTLAPEESLSGQCECPKSQPEPRQSINCRCGQPLESFQLSPIYGSCTCTCTSHVEEEPSIQGGQETSFESQETFFESPEASFESKKPASEKREAIPKQGSTETDYTRSGYRPRAYYLANDYHQLMRRVARRRPTKEPQKRKKPTSRASSKTRQKPAPKKAPVGQAQAKPKPKPRPNPKPKMKPKPRTPSPVCPPVQSPARPLNPQVRWQRIVKRKKESQCRKVKSLPVVPESQSSIRSLAICQAQSDIPAAGSQSQSESCQGLPQSSSLGFVSCQCADEESIPSRSPSQKPSCLCQSLPANESERMVSCQSVEEPQQQEPLPQEDCFPQEKRNPLVRRSRSPTPQRKKEHKESCFQTPRRCPVPKKKRPPSCSSCSSGRMPRERSSSSHRCSPSQASNCRCQRKQAPKRRPQPIQNYDSYCYRHLPPCSHTETTNRSLETSLASSSWSQQQQPQRRWGEQSFQSASTVSYPSCWHQHPLSSNLSSFQEAYTSQESSQAHQRSVMRQRRPIQWQPPVANTPSQGCSHYSHLETGRRYYTDTQLNQALPAVQCSCRSLHSSCSIRALSSNTDSIRCPCAPAPSVASVEPEPPREVEEEQQQYYHYQEAEPEPEPTYLQESPPPAACACSQESPPPAACACSQESPPPAACACSQSCQCKRLKFFSHKPAYFNDSLRLEEQEHRHAHTTLSTRRPPPKTRCQNKGYDYDLSKRKEQMPVYHNACYYPDVNYKSWQQDQRCQAMQATSLEDSQRYQPYAYGGPVLYQPAQYFAQGRYQARGAGAGAIAAAAQGLRGLVKALGGARHREGRANHQEAGYMQETMEEPGIMVVEETPREAAFPQRNTNYSTNVENNYQYQYPVSMPAASCYVRESAESERIYARLAAGKGRARGGKPARERKRGTAVEALASFSSGLDFSSKRERKDASSVKEEEEAEPTPLAIFLDNLRAKHDASQFLKQKARRKEPEVIALQDTSSSEDLEDADESRERKKLTLHRSSEEETLIFPATYTGLLEEQIIDEYLPRPRYKRRK